MFPTIPLSRLRSTKNSARDPSSTTATRISGPSAFTASILFIRALQFVAPAPEHRDIRVALWARVRAGRGCLGTTQAYWIQGIAKGVGAVAHCLLLTGPRGYCR